MFTQPGEGDVTFISILGLRKLWHSEIELVAWGHPPTSGTPIQRWDPGLLHSAGMEIL